jgi:hypothetical protein
MLGLGLGLILLNEDRHHFGQLADRGLEVLDPIIIGGGGLLIIDGAALLNNEAAPVNISFDVGQSLDIINLHRLRQIDIIAAFGRPDLVNRDLDNKLNVLGHNLISLDVITYIPQWNKS